MSGIYSSLTACVHEFDAQCRRRGNHIHVYSSISDSYARLNLQAGSVILLLVANSDEFIRHWVALVENGLVPVTAAPSTRMNQIHDLVRRLNVCAVVGALNLQGLFRNAEFSQIGSYTVALERARGPVFNAGQAILLTSGTSGSSTACLHDVSSLLRNASLHIQALGIRSTDRQLVTLPLYFSYALVAQTIGSLLCGCEILIEPPPLSGKQFVKSVIQSGATVSALTPTIAKAVLKETKIELRLRVLGMGGDQADSNDIASILNLNLADEVYLTYGLTEAGPRVATLAAHDVHEDELTSVGVPLPAIEAVIDQPNAVGQGELLLKTPTAMLSRVGGSDGADARADFTASGFLRTGDLFEKTSRGNLRFIGRKKEFVVVEGMKVHTRSVSKAAGSFPGVNHVKTYQNSDGMLCMSIQPEHNVVIDLAQLRRHMASRLQRHEFPSKIQVDQDTGFVK